MAWVKSCSKGFRTMLDTDCDRIKENAIILQNRGEIGKSWENDGKMMGKMQFHQTSCSSDWFIWLT
jgi:hypothetical protein